MRFNLVICIIYCLCVIYLILYAIGDHYATYEHTLSKDKRGVRITSHRQVLSINICDIGLWLRIHQWSQVNSLLLCSHCAKYEHPQSKSERVVHITTHNIDSFWHIIIIFDLDRWLQKSYISVTWIAYCYHHHPTAKREQDSSPTRQFTDTIFEDSLPAELKTVHWHYWRQFIDIYVLC